MLEKMRCPKKVHRKYFVWGFWVSTYFLRCWLCNIICTEHRNQYWYTSCWMLAPWWRLRVISVNSNYSCFNIVCRTCTNMSSWQTRRFLLILPLHNKHHCSRAFAKNVWFSSVEFYIWGSKIYIIRYNRIKPVVMIKMHYFQSTYDD